MKQLWSLRFLLPFAVLTLSVLVIGLSMVNSLLNRQEQMKAEAQERAQATVARTARAAERYLRIDPQSLDEEITQLSTDPSLRVAALIDPTEVIRFSTNLTWRIKTAASALPKEDLSVLRQALQTREAVLQESADGDRLMIIMSFVAPTEQQTLRSLDRGAIYLVYDLSEKRTHARLLAVQELIPELSTLLLASLVLVWVLHAQVSQPLARIRAAAKEIAKGNFQTLPRQPGPDDIQALTDAFNRMSVQLALQVEQLANQASHTQAILDNAIDGIITIDQQGIVSSLNQSAERIFGYPANEVMGRNIKMLMPEPYHSQHDGYLQNYLSSGHAHIIGIGREVEGRRKDGSVFPIDLAVSEIQYQGAPLFIGMVRDITERKRVERMKSEFVSTVSHELRTPLTSISGALGLLAGGAMGPLSAEVKSLLDIAQKNSCRLTHLINDLLDMEKIAAGKMQFDLEKQALMPLVEQALEANKAYGEQHHVRFQLIGPERDVLVRVDSSRLIQVLSNYLSNAAKFSPANSPVVVTVTCSGARVRVAVRDTGPGIPSEFRERIFQKFSQADSSDTRTKGGTGLGLAITKELIEHMGGEVGFESTEGVGSVFFFELPADDLQRGVPD